MPNQDHMEAQAFLKALYKHCDPALWLELRCIHPMTGKVKVLWSVLGDELTQATILAQSVELNRAGYGVYFAPCPRREKQGKAEAAALLSALWVDLDCDDDPARRTGTMDKLHSFNLPPSAVIDSGNGLHAYWLLSEPLSLDEDSRKQTAGILRGLFSALDGDPRYVKSVASVMRLPGSVNTKPERGGAVVTLLELHSDRRYLLNDFHWLESQPQVECIGGLNVVTLNGNGHHPLPKRTEDYLTNGASVGSRNTELFAAACQLRDAGDSQSEAERQLVPRYVADGCSEREALATIKSAYSRLPRDPLPDPVSEAHTQVTRLVEQHMPSRDKPDPQQIAAAVVACSRLNAIEWAEERTRLKTLCGDGLKVSDLDRMYRQAKRQREQEALAEIEEAERYVLIDGGMVFEKLTERGTSRQRITTWSGKVIERISRVDDDGQVEHLTKLELLGDEEHITLIVPSELFGDPNALHRAIAGRAGESFSTRAGMQRHLGPALLALSGIYPRRTTYRFFGWTQIDKRWAFITPGCAVDSAGIAANPPEVELEIRLRDYSLNHSPWAESLAAFRAVIDVFPEELAPALIAFALLPVVQRFFPAAAPKPALHLVGTTGSGKSEIAALMTSFYGQFTRDTPPAQWGDTVNTVETLGYGLADALYWVDDWKSCYSDERAFTRFLQSYSRGMGRGRLTKDAKVRQERPCRGLLLSTGETTIEGEASILSRMLVLEISPWEQRDSGGKRLFRAESLRTTLPGFTVYFAQWIAAQIEKGAFQNNLAREYELKIKGYRDLLNMQLRKQANTGRVISNWAVLETVYRLLRTFLEEQNAREILPGWQNRILETVNAVQEERAGQIFINTLEQLLASGDVRLIDLGGTEDVKPGTPVIGYQDEQFIYLLPEVALREVKPTQSLHFSAKAIGDQLREDGWLVAGNGAGHLTVQMRIQGHRVRLWRLKRAMLDGDDGDSGATEENEVK